MSTISFDSLHPDVVVVGGGPVGLWTAIQTKILTKKDILVIEKYTEYKRADIRLNINTSSLSGIPDYEPLKKFVQKWGNKAVPIKEMEDELIKCAYDLGIEIIRGKTVNPKQLQEQFPTARVFIGADGARSAVRKEIFGNQYKFNTPLQYLVQARYMIKTPIEYDLPDSSFERVRRVAENYSKQKFAGHLIIQNIIPRENGLSEVILRIFIQEKTYREMADATFSNPYYFETDLDKVPDVLRDTLIKWWGTHDQDIITDVIKTNKLTVIPLA
jgi:2-polyprenyl-6-methoxyphenol hydroxylase-like FAD-dependent oxidoreductase